MKRWIHASEEIDEIEDDDDFWTPYGNGTYLVTSGYGDSVNTNDPVEAITLWYKFQAKNPMDVSISCEKREQAVELCKAATADLLTKLDEKYKNPYKLEYMIEEAKEKVADGQKWFYEGKYGYGDSIHPFSFG